MASSCRIAIVGGGLAGLAAAHALKTFGIKAQVFEAAPTLGEIGAAVNVSPQAAKALQAVDLGDKIAAVATSSPGIYTRNMHSTTGARLRRVTALPITPFTAPTFWRRSQAGSIMAPFISGTASQHWRSEATVPSSLSPTALASRPRS